MALMGHALDSRHQNIFDRISIPCAKQVRGRGICFADLVQRHWDVVVNERYIDLKGNATGLAFELILTDALIQWGVDHKVVLGQVKNTRYNAEIDILLSHRPHHGHAVGLMLKTSLRERWKQADRDALIWRKAERSIWDSAQLGTGMVIPGGQYIDQVDLDIWVLTIRENPKEEKFKAVARMRNNDSKYLGVRDNRTLSIYDDERMQHLLEACLKVSNT